MKIIIFLFFIYLSCYCTESLAQNDNPIEIKNWELSIARGVDHWLQSEDIHFSEIYIVGADLNGQHFLLTPSSLGKALLINFKLAQKNPTAPYPGKIHAQMILGNEPAGHFILEWKPASDLLDLIGRLLLLVMDRGFVRPQFIRDFFTESARDNYKTESFKLIWKNWETYNKSSHKLEFLEFLKSTASLETVEPDKNELTEIIPPASQDLKMSLQLSYFGDPVKNRTHYLLESKIDLPASLQCRFTVDSDYNPFAQGRRATRVKTQCSHNPSNE